jgi:RimJ/RimL family protein N-acetyltransferase
MTRPFVDPELVLEDARVLLRPISLADIDAFARVAFNPNIWRFFVSSITSPAELEAFVNEAVQTTRAGQALAFTIVDKESSQVAGTMRFGNLSLRDERVEIGWSWLGEPFQGTGINSRSKLLMMQYAFEAHAMKRVEYKTDVLNVVARHALRKVGATEEGVLRSHTLMHGGRRRDTIYYSVLAAEWPEVKQRLLALIDSDTRGGRHGSRSS